MNKRQLFRLATLSFLVLLLFLMPQFINQVPIVNNGTFALLFEHLAKLLNLSTSQKVYGTQFINATFIWLTILLVTRFIKLVLGWRSALFGAILLFLTPRFIGASVLNLIDIPFTFAYILTITQIYSFARELPRFKTKRIIFISLSSLFTVAIHPAGLILIVYIFFFLLLSFILKINARWHKVTNKKFAFIRLITLLSSLSILIVIVAFFVAKFIYKIPITHPFAALDLLNNFNNADLQIFESRIIQQNQVPNYYLVKYLFITIPLVTFIGIAFFFVFINKMRKELNPLLMFVVMGTLFYPIIYTYFANTTATTYWTIYYMSIPLFVIVAVMGVEYVLRSIDDRYVNTIISIVLFLLLLPPFRHVIVTAPATAVYFNEISGTVSSAYGKFSFDYNSHYPQIASKWLITHMYDYDIRDFKDNDTILVITDTPINCDTYFEESPYIKVKKGSYQEFQSGVGQYFMSFANQQNPKDLKNKVWPPSDAVYTIIVEDNPVATFIKQKDLK